ncbi:MAG: DUF1217 domain-containing protein [Roseovarius sp.]
MTFQPVVPTSGLNGWIFLQSTLDRQTAQFDASPAIIRDTDYFEQNIGQVRTAEDLVSDRRLLRVALGAFGLQDDINSRAFVETILSEGTSDDDALANRLTDDRYSALSEAFGFDQLVPETLLPGFATDIIQKFRSRSFEIAVGNQDNSLRLALNTQRELADIVTSDESENAKWFTIMGTAPLREVFETVLGLPPGFGQLDLDQQLEEFQDRAERQLGINGITDLADPERLESLIERYLLRDQIKQNASSFSSASIALTLLQSAAR